MEQRHRNVGVFLQYVYWARAFSSSTARRMSVCDLYSCPSCGILQNECLWSVLLSKLWHSAEWMSVICTLVQVVAFCRQSKPWFSNRIPEKENIFSEYYQYWLPNYSLLTLSFKAWQLITVQNIQTGPSILAPCHTKPFRLIYSMCRYVRSGGIDFQEVGEGNLCDTATFRTISAWKLVAMGATFLFKKKWKVISLGEMFSVHSLLN